MGSRQTVSSELTPREFHPNCRSDRAALIACDGSDIETTLGQEVGGSSSEQYTEGGARVVGEGSEENTEEQQ